MHLFPIIEQRNFHSRGRWALLLSLGLKFSFTKQKKEKSKTQQRGTPKTLSLRYCFSAPNSYECGISPPRAYPIYFHSTQKSPLVKLLYIPYKKVCNYSDINST